ncbi:MAG: 50S ribosomal protein L3 N(5)-glutamine methyltransferase [Janthinobacterium lividum]
MTHPFSTLRDLLRYAVTRFGQAKVCYGHGSLNAYDEAAYLILHTLNLPLDMLEPFLDARLLDAEREALLAVIERRTVDRIPAAYITREAWMHGYRFYVDERTIVPRSFIGELLQERLQPWIADGDAVGSVLELCTGSGCLAILAAIAFPDARIDAVDLSAQALEVAAINLADYALEPRVSLYQGDLYAPLPESARYDLLLSNPPYVNDGSMARLPAEYQHEPVLALAGGSDGMDIVRRIVAGARAYLHDAGLLVVEIGNERANVEADPLLGSLPLTWATTSGGDDTIFMIQAVDLPDPHAFKA